MFKPCFLGSKEPPEDGENMVMPQSKSVTRFGLRQDWSLGDGGDNDDKSAAKDIDFYFLVLWIGITIYGSKWVTKY